jgi:hypothetical protein
MILKNYFRFLALTTCVSCSSGTTNNAVDKSTKLYGPISDTSIPMTQKKFKEAYNTAVFTTKFVITDNRDITEVHHDEDDGAWQFFSDDKFDDFSKVVMVVGLGQITTRDSSLFEVADMPMGYVAHRKFKGDKWIIEKKN